MAEGPWDTMSKATSCIKGLDTEVAEVSKAKFAELGLHFENEITSRNDWIRPSLAAASVSCMEDSTV